jgi:hypothetical protein
MVREETPDESASSEGDVRTKRECREHDLKNQNPSLMPRKHLINLTGSL